MNFYIKLGTGALGMGHWAWGMEKISHSQPIAYSPLPIAHCPLPDAHCPIPHSQI
jgi:hypothetical protein